MKIKLELEITNNALKQYKKLRKENQNEILEIIDILLKDIMNNTENHKEEFEAGKDYPEEGLVRPEKLKKPLTGYWGRRIDKKNRLVYRVKTEEKVIETLSFYGHYSDK
ncbi:MAG: type II toxin-antitoxin system YoeB family toxin [Fusobacteriales bacterium]|jgi:Txe/YoeB family toxin of Txe-Axe toxin-antitoxin module|nr:type II toxin-antitoxin system YoeB family toxin [Fusobacteriales bacterium]